MRTSGCRLGETLRDGASDRLTARQWLGLGGVLAALVGLSGCGAGTAALPPNLPFVPGGVAIVTSSLINGIAGRSYSVNIQTSGGTPPVAHCNLVGAPPNGMHADRDGPNCKLVAPQGSMAAGAYTFSVQAFDSASPPTSDSRVYTLVVRPEFAITQVSLVDGVQGRSYGVTTQTCSGGARCVQPVTTSVSTATGNGPLASCDVSPNNLGLAAVRDDLDPSRCLLRSTGLARAGTFNVTISAIDNPIPDPGGGGGVPANTRFSNPLTLIVHPPLSVQLHLGSPPDGVQGRTYGAPRQDLAYTVAPNAGVGTISMTGTGFPAPIACTNSSDGRMLTCNSHNMPVIGDPDLYNPMVIANDTANAATPAATDATDANKKRTDMLKVDAPLGLDPPTPDPFPGGVTQRNYGAGMGCSGGDCMAIKYTAHGGLPSDIFAPSGFPAGFMHNQSGTMLTCFAQPVIGPPGTYNTSVAVDDTANPTTPSASASGTAPPPITRSLTINTPLMLVPDPMSADIGGIPPDGVKGRTYGNTGAGFKQLKYNALQGLPPYRFDLPPTVMAPTPNGVPAAVACMQAGTMATCTSDAFPITANVGSYPFMIKLDDAGNATTPSASASGTAPNPINRSLAIHPQLSVSVNFPDPFPEGVTQRNYGAGMGCSGEACVSIKYTAQGGLSPYSFTPSGFPAGFTHNQSGNMFTCFAAPVTGPPRMYLPMVTVSDTANAATPAATDATDPQRKRTDMLKVDAPLGLDPPMPDPFPDGVTQRNYGAGTGCSGGDCMPIKYTAHDGLPSEIFTPSGFPAGFTHSQSGNMFTCFAQPVTGLPDTYNTSVAVDDTANPTTPSASASGTQPQPVNRNLHINVEMSFTMQPPSPFPDGVTLRRYGTGMGCSPNDSPCMPLKYTVAPDSGLGQPYTFTPNNFPSGFICPASGNDGLCSANPITGMPGSYTMLTVQVSDTANVSTPSGSRTSPPPPGMMTVDAEIAIINASPLSNGQLNQPYSVLFHHNGGGTGDPNKAAAMFTWTDNGGLPGVTFTTPMPVAQPGDATYAGLPTAIGTTTVGITVKDDGNATTPPCSAAGTCPNKSFQVTVLLCLAYVDATTPMVLPIDTSTDPVTVLPVITLPDGATPVRPAVSPNGTDVFVADPGLHQVHIIDTQMGSIRTKTVQGLSNMLGDTRDISVGPQKAPSQSGFNPDSVFAYVANPTTDNVQVIDGDPSSPSFGQLVSTITLNGFPLSPGAQDLKVTPTVLNGTTRDTRAYVVRPGGDEVCVIDTEPTSLTFLQQIVLLPPGGNERGCIPLGLPTGVAAKFIQVTPDGRFAFVSKSDGTQGLVKVIDTEPGSPTRDTVLATLDLTPAGCAVPEDIGSSTNGQTVLVPCSDSQQVIRISTGISFPLQTAVATPNPADAPKDIAFKPDGTLALVTLSGTDKVLPINLTTEPPRPGDPVGTAPLSGPDGVDHIPDPSLHITTSVLPSATQGAAYASSVVASGGNQAYTFTDVNGILSTLGLTLSPNGKITSNNVTGAPGTYSILIQVLEDPSTQPVVNKVQKTVTLTIMQGQI